MKNLLWCLHRKCSLKFVGLVSRYFEIFRLSSPYKVNLHQQFCSNYETKNLILESILHIIIPYEITLNVSVKLTSETIRLLMHYVVIVKETAK